MTHDEGRMQKVWSFFLIKCEADTPLTQIKTGEILQKGPKPLSVVGFCTLLPWTGISRHGNNQQKCRCSLQRVKPETTSPTSHRSVPNSSDIWRSHLRQTGHPRGYTAVSELPAECRETPASCKILKALSALVLCPEIHVVLKYLKCEKAAYRQCNTWFRSQVLHHS